MIAPIFIEARRLGVLEPQINRVLQEADKRKRKSGMRRIVQLLRELQLIPYPTQQLTEDGTADTTSPFALALGVNCNGDRILVVAWESVHIQGDLPT